MSNNVSWYLGGGVTLVTKDKQEARMSRGRKHNENATICEPPLMGFGMALQLEGHHCVRLYTALEDDHGGGLERETLGDILEMKMEILCKRKKTDCGRWVHKTCKQGLRFHNKKIHSKIPSFEYTGFWMQKSTMSQ